MLKPSPVMSDLHQISAKIAATAKNMKTSSAAQDGQTAQDAAASSDSNGNADPAVSESAVPQKKRPDKRLAEALARRCEDYEMSRRDLTVRVVKSTAILERRLAELDNEREILQSALRRLTEFQNDLKQDSPILDADPDNQTALSFECRKLEDMRLETIRLVASLPQPGRSEPAAERQSVQEPIRPEDVGFLRMLGWGFAFQLPLALGILIAALILGVLIVGAFSGALRW